MERICQGCNKYPPRVGAKLRLCFNCKRIARINCLLNNTLHVKHKCILEKELTFIQRNMSAQEFWNRVAKPIYETVIT